MIVFCCLFLVTGLFAADTDTPLPEGDGVEGVSQEGKRQISGTVVDETGEPVIGANVVEKGTTNGIVTDVDGNFSLSVSGGAVLQVSYIGYIMQDVPTENRSSFNIRLVEDAKALEEVVVIGYGSTSKRKLTSSVSTILPDQIENLPSSSVVNNLGGRTAGIIVTNSGGGPNSFASISIRGGGTPIVVIDGVVTDYNDFRNINQYDIENISILKDAAAAAIYGARAGNGILMVTTKRGANKKISINYNYSYTLSQPTILPDKLGSYERLVETNKAYANDGMPYAYSDEILEKYRTQSDPFVYPNTDWLAVCLKNFAPESNHNLSINGGDNRNKYFASFGYYDQGTLYIHDTNWYNRYNARVGLENNFEEIGLKTTTTVSGTFTEYRHPSTMYGNGYGTWGHIMNQSPTQLAYNDMGELSSATTDSPIVEIDPGGGYLLQRTSTFNGLFQAEWKVPGVEGFKLKSVSDYRIGYYRNKEWKFTPPRYANGSTAPAPNNPPSLSEEYGENYSYTQQFLADYEQEVVTDFTVGALLGYEFNASSNNWMSASRENYQLATDQFLAGPTANQKNNGAEAESGRAAYIGRLKLDYKARYMLDASFRRDGSDWFPEDKRWGTFYAFSGAWTLSDESFMQRLKDDNILNYFKLRGSYGVVGLDGSNANLNRYEYVAGYNVESNANV
ncbi:MAG: SusC/RagA family TonB-linked outer membrane protein, partial [Tannerellaceae bacterium]|nr:SusC/RagA family TonB-linked outer membrane protein [Tannerellaceae bacterium]